MLKKTAPAIAILVMVIVLFAGSWSCRSGDTGTITIGTNPIELNALVYVADDQQFFKNNGLQVSYKSYDTGVLAVEGLLKGEADIAMTTEFVIVGKTLQKADLLSLATVDKSLLFYLVSRNDRGIKTIADLPGKRIGVPRETIMEFYLGRTLELNGMNIQQVSLVDTRASDPEGALAGGGIDAVVTWDPYVTRIKQHLGDNVTITPVQSNQVSFWCAVSTSGWVKEHPGLAKQFLRSLSQAEEYLVSHESDVKAIIGKRLNYDAAYLATIWPENQFSLSLDQSLLAALEDEARWMIKNNLTPAKTVPDFMNYLYLDGLKSVKPKAVQIIR